MSCQVTALCKSLVTPYLDDKSKKATWVSAEVWLLPCVGPQVGFEVEVKTELLVTKLAHIRLLSL